MYSQFGAEAILAECLQRTGVRFRACCEFGAWDGLLHSNTAALVLEQGWHGTFIESRQDRFAECATNYLGTTANVIHSAVTIENINTLVPQSLDVLSIDVDGNDYWLWQVLEHRPSVVIIEYNGRLPEDHVIRPYDPAFVRQENDYGYGATQRQLIELAAEKRYTLLADDGNSNLFFGADEVLNAASL